MFNLIKRERAPRYILLVVISFALCVLVTRWYLYLTGYPQIGNDYFHISHVLWGGILFTLGAFLLLIYSNARIYYISAILIGGGMGFFYDEVGKFVTQTNDYFFQAAAPIIYITVLLTFFLYVYIKRPRKKSAKEIFYQVLDDCKEILDEDLDPLEKEAIKQKLKTIRQTSENPDLQRFAKSLSRIISKLEEQSQPHQSWFVTVFLTLKTRLAGLRSINIRLFRVIVLLLIGRSLSSLANLIAAWESELGRGRFQRFLSDPLAEAIQSGSIYRSVVFWQTVAEGIVGLIIICALWKRFTHQASGIRIIRIAMLFSICTIDVIGFYVEQFSHVFSLALDLFIISFIDFYGKVYDEGKL